MNADVRPTSAALLLGAVVMGVAMPPASMQRVDCELPFESAADAGSGFSTEVGCGAAPSRSDLRGPARLLFGLRLDLNRASEAALEALPAIGPARAAAIIQARTAQRFESLADLQRVAGIGPKTSEGLRPWAAVTSPSGSAGEADTATGGGPWTVR